MINRPDQLKFYETENFQTQIKSTIIQVNYFPSGALKLHFGMANKVSTRHVMSNIIKHLLPR